MLDAVGVVTLLLGVAGLRLPWGRLPLRAPLALVLVAFALVCLADLYGGVSAYSYAVYYVVVFVWVGLGQPPGTSLWLALPAAGAYLLPLLLADPVPPTSLASVTVAVPVCVLLGEVLARAVRNLQDSRRALQRRVEVVEQLAVLAADLGRDLDPDAVGSRLVLAARQVLGARSAVFLMARGDDLVVTAVAGQDAQLVGHVLPREGSRTAQAAEQHRLLVTGDDALPPLPGRGGSAVSVACTGPGLLGGLTVLLATPPEQVTDEERDLLRLLGGQATAALVNARAYQAVLRSQEHEQAVVDVLADGVLVLGPDGLVRACNGAAALALGLPAEQVVGHRPPVEVPAPGSSLEQQTAPGHWVEALATGLPDSEEVVVALRDISSRRELDAAKDLFLATASHELRTPLTAVKGYVWTLQRRWEVLSEPARRAAIDTISTQTDALVRLTDHLLLGARAGAGTASRRRERFDVADVVRAVAATHAQASERHRVVVEAPNGLPPALGDRTAVESALGQLVENAVKYSPDGGDVVLHAQASPDGLEVEVRDRGVGLPEGGEDALFAAFSQGAPVNTRTFGGVGLGLHIVRQLVTAQGGSVSATNREGGGAVFRVLLPAASPEA